MLSFSLLKHFAFVLGCTSPLLSMMLTYFAAFQTDDLRHIEPWAVALLGFGIYAIPLLILGIILSSCLRRPQHPMIRYFLGVATFYAAHVALFAWKTGPIS